MVSSNCSIYLSHENMIGKNYHTEFFYQKLWVHSFGVIWITVIDPGWFKSYCCIKGGDGSVTRVGSFVGLWYRDVSDHSGSWFKSPQKNQHSHFMSWYVPLFKSHRWQIFRNKQCTISCEQYLKYLVIGYKCSHLNVLGLLYFLCT